MAELKCPHCGQAFTVDDTELGSIVQQIRDQEFNKDVSNRVSELQQHLEEKHILEMDAQKDKIKLQIQGEHEKEIKKLQEQLRKSEENAAIISIMFEMKNEMDTTSTKHKNEDFFKELDKDRKEKKCEYAVLVSLLESDSELYNAGIVDVSYRFEKMYVVRPQCFIPIITLLRNAAMNALTYKQQLAEVKNQDIDISNFEDNLLKFKDEFGKNYQLAHSHFDKAIEEIDKTIQHLEKVKKELQGFTDTYQESFFADYAERLMNYSGLEEIIDYNDDEIKKICEKIVGNAIKWKKWPTTIWMLPEGMDYKKYLPVCKTADGREVAYFSHYNWSPVRTVNVYRHDILEALRQLSSVTGVDLSDVPTDFETVKELFVADDTGEVSSCKDIPGFKTGLVRSLVAKLKPEDLDDIARIIGMAHGTNVWSDNQEKIVEEYGLGAKDIICNREDIYDYLLSKGFESGEAYDISECIRKGIPKSKKTSWLKWKKDMFNADVPTWYIEACEKIRYLLPRANSVSYALMRTRMAWFKLNYPKEYRMVVEELGL